MDKKISIKSTGIRSGDTIIKLDSKNSLGLIQKVKWENEVGDIPKAELFTFLTPVELEVLQKNTELKFVFDRNYFWANIIYYFKVWFCQTWFYSNIYKKIIQEESHKKIMHKFCANVEQKRKTKLITQIIKDFVNEKLTATQAIEHLTK